MTNKVIKYGFMIIAAVLLIGLVFAGAASATQTITDAQNLTDYLNGVQAGTASVSGNTVTLLKNVALPQELIFDNGGSAGEITLDLETYSISSSGTHRFATVKQGLTFTLAGNANTGKITGFSAEKGGAVFIDEGKFIMAGGNITGCTATDSTIEVFGGAVYIRNGEFNMTGGTIANCQAIGVAESAYGGAVCLYRDGAITTFNMSNTAKIIGCTAKSSSKAGEGGAVYTWFNTDKYGSGTCTFTMSDSASISGCKAALGGGIHLYDVYSTFIMKDSALISGCSAGIAGGVDIAWGKFEMRGGTITGCTASNYAAGVTVGEEEGFVVSESATITADNDVVLNKYFNQYEATPSWHYYNIQLDTSVAFTGSINSITLHNFSNGQVVDAEGWLGESVVTNGHDYLSKFVLSPVHLADYHLEDNGSNLVLAEGGITIEYPINITNATGTYQLTSKKTKVYGDDGSGYVHLTSVEDGTFTLELNNFKANSSVWNASVIRTSAGVSDLNIVLTGTSTLVADISNDSYTPTIRVEKGNLTIKAKAGDVGKLIVNQTQSNTAKACACAISVANPGSLSIEGKNTVVEANANSIGSGSSCVYTIEVSTDITISSATVTATAESDDLYVETIDLYGALTISDAKVTVQAKTNSGGIITICCGGSSGILINENSEVEVLANSTDGYVYCITLNSDFTLNSAKFEAHADSTSDFAYAIYADSDVTLNSAEFEAYANSTSNYACTVYVEGDVILNSAEFEAYANSTSSYARTVSAEGDLTIGQIKKITAIGTGADTVNSSSFAYYSDLDIDALKTGYTFSNASVSGAEPNSYTAFANNWHTDDNGYSVSDYNAVTIEKTQTPAPKKHSESKDMGSTIILTETVTPTPVPTATPAATAVPTIATVKPTSQQTSKSPAPFIGLIAGLGAAAALLRLRK